MNIITNANCANRTHSQLLIRGDRNAWRWYLSNANGIPESDNLLRSLYGGRAQWTREMVQGTAITEALDAMGETSSCNLIAPT